jgi:hypothetical protein
VARRSDCRRHEERRKTGVAFGPANDECHETRQEDGSRDRVSADLVDTKVDVPAARYGNRVEVRSERTENERNGDGVGELARPSSRRKRDGEGDVGEWIHGGLMGGRPSAQPLIYVRLGVPVSIEVVPVLGMFTDTEGQLIRELLRRQAGRLVARQR